MASSSSSSLSSAVSLQEKYDVFLSFRGEDTRKGFASYLYAALSANKILTFMDDHELETGDEISPTLRKAIEESKISVIIFSESYASSTWCLDELVQILECRRTNGQIVMPIFYRVEPSVVRKQKGSYGVAFAELEQRFKARMEKLEQWRAALKEASDLCGLDSKDFRSENKLVQKIVEDISLKLPKYLSLDEHFKGHLVGIEKHIKEIELLLSISTKDVRIIGIWGMGGIGKTTLASVVFHNLSSSNHFEGCFFVRNVREEFARFGLDHLRRKLVSNLLNVESNLIMDSLLVASPLILDRLRRKKVFIVLDDVDSSIQLDALLEGYHQLACGSRIIVTTRNKQVLMKETDYIYKAESLNHIESIKLFHLHAFGKNSTAVDDKMVLEVTTYAKGNPLALKVLGSFLSSRSKEDWESALKRLKRFPNPEIQDVLRISYEGLDDKGIKGTFLDIACLFDSSFTRDYAESLLDDGSSSVKIEISVLIEKSLIENMSEGHTDNELWMHDLLRQMGREIARDEDKEPSNRSRLCDAMEVCKVLENSMGTKAVEVISLNTFEIKKNVTVCREAFSNMRNLRILKIYYFDFCHRNTGGNEFKLYIPQDLDFYLCNKIRLFWWDFYPLKLLPSNFIPENLVELVLYDSHVEKLWNNCKVQFPVLRRIDLSYSKFLSQLPDLSQAPNLESIDLERCTSLVQIHLSLQNLDKLTYLNLYGCSKLRDFQDISTRTEGCLDVVRFGGIKNVLNNFTYLKSCIQRFTSNLCLYSSQAHISQKFAPNLRYLNLSGTAIETVPPSIGYLSGLVELNLVFCKRLKSLPTSICHLKSLESLNLLCCQKLKTFPEILEPMEHLRSLDLGASGIKELPESIENLISLTNLYVDYCKNLEFLPNSLCKLRKLERISLCNCERLKYLPELPSQCLRLSAGGCTSLENISTWKAPLLHNLDIMPNEFLSLHIDFFGCEKLAQNTRNSVLADIAVTKILSCLIFANTCPNVVFRSVPICRYPGDEIPKWFSYQTCGSSINNIMLPPYWNNDDFLGFAFCIVLRGSKIYKITYFDFEFELNFKTIDHDHLYRCRDYCGRLFEETVSSSDHLVIWCVDKSELPCSTWNMESCSTEASFNVWPSDNSNEDEYCEIKKFGVRFVYKEDIERYDAETERKNKRRFYECHE